MLSNRVGGVVIPFPRPFRAPVPPPAPPARLAWVGAWLRPASAMPADWRRMACDAAVLGLLAVGAWLQAVVLAQAFGL